jgi:hypothetical protein
MSDARTDWSAILAGAVLATAIALVLIAFGVALGLGASSPYEGEGASRALFATAAGVWLLWIQLVSFSAGGYVAGRLRARKADESEHETDVRDAMHGLLVWGVGVIAAAVISFGSLNAAGRTADDAANAAPASIAQAAAEEAAQASRGASRAAGGSRAQVGRDGRVCHRRRAVGRRGRRVLLRAHRRQSPRP